MIKFLSLIAFLLYATFCAAQTLTFEHGKVEFRTTTIMSDIDAVSDEMTATVDVESGVVEIIIPIASFEFEYEMMQEHFNEEYLESDKYPNATFKGRITQDVSNIQEATQVDITGDLTIHGITNRITFNATLSKKEDFMRAKCSFPIIFKDYNVDEPSILTKSVAKDVELKAVIYLK